MMYLREIENIKKMYDESAKASHARRIAADRKLLIYSNNYKSLVVARIHEVISTQSVKSEVVKFAAMRSNLLRQVTDTIATVYDVPPRRVWGVSGPGEEWLRSQSQNLNSEWEQWGKMAWLLGVIHLVPSLEIEEDGSVEVCVEAIYPNKCEGFFAPNKDEPDILVWETDDGYIAADAERYQWFSKDWRLVDDKEHTYGHRPWVALRARPVLLGDYWDSHSCNDLIDATIDVARIQAMMEWIRKTHSNNLNYVVLRSGGDAEDDGNVPAGQTPNADTFLVARGDTQFGSLPNVIEIGPFEAHVNSIYNDVCQNYGIPTEAVRSSGRTMTPADWASIVKQRDKQKKHFERAEKRLARSLVWLGTPVATGLAQWSADNFRVIYAPTMYVDHPKVQVEIYQAMASVGATDPVEFYLSQHPELTHEEAKLAVLGHVSIRSEIHDIMAARQIPADASKDLYDVPQNQGSQRSNPDSSVL